MKKSDEAIVEEKPANKGPDSRRSRCERRAIPEAGKPKHATGRRAGGACPRRRTGYGSSSREPKSRLTALLHHITVDALRKAYGELKRWAAPGVDGMTWKEYAVGLEDRLVDLHDRVQRGAYRATPSRRVKIPKADGGTRPLGVAALEDKIVQKAVADNLLTRRFMPVPGVQLRVSAWPRGARCAGRPAGRDRAAEDQVDYRPEHTRILRQRVAGLDAAVSEAPHRG